MPEAFYKSPFQIDHIISRQHGGESSIENVAFSCFHCNTHKGPNVAGLDPETGEVVRLFHPRTDVWARHFQWAGAALIGVTVVGRVTIGVLAINDSDYVAARLALIEEGGFLR